MSHFNLDFAPTPLDAFDELRAAQLQARTVCEQLVEDDESSMVTSKARLVAALPLIIGTLSNCMSPADLAKMLIDFAEQVDRDGIVIQHGRVMSLH